MECNDNAIINAPICVKEKAMRNPYQSIIDALRVTNVGLQLKGKRSVAIDGIDLAMKNATSFLWIETELYTIKEMLEEDSIHREDIIVAIVNLTNELRSA